MNSSHHSYNLELNYSIGKNFPLAIDIYIEETMRKN